MSKLTETQIELITEYYVKSFHAWETYADVYNVVKKYNNNKKFIQF